MIPTAEYGGTSDHLPDLTGRVRKTGAYYFDHGGVADVWLGAWSRGHATQVVAVKIIRGIWNNAEYLEQHKVKLLREARVWSQVNHPNITPFYGVCFDLGPPSTPCLVCPYFVNGNLATYLQQNPLADRLKFVSQVGTGLAYLHRQKIIHGDVKATNVLVNNEHQACIADFGLSRILGASGFTTKSIGGTYRWMAYELIAYEFEGNPTPKLTKVTDVWAFGMTVLEILTRRLPFFQFKSDGAVIGSLMRGDRPTHETSPEIDANVWSMLERCWHLNPSQRPSMDALSQYFDTIRKYHSERRTG